MTVLFHLTICVWKYLLSIIYMTKILYMFSLLDLSLYCVIYLVFGMYL